MVKFKPVLTRFADDDRRLDAYVPLTKVHRPSVYILKLVPESLDTEYAVFIRAERKSDMLLGELVRRLEQYMENGSSSFPSRYRLNYLPTSRLNPYANPQLTYRKTHDDLKFPDPVNTESLNNELDEKAEEEEEPKMQVETFSESEIHRKTSTPNATTSIQYDANIQMLRTNDLLQPYGTQIEMGTQSDIILEPGTTGTLYFEVTNFKKSSVFHYFRVVDESSYLLNLRPQNVLIAPGQKYIVTLTVIIPRDVAQGTMDRITLTATDGRDVLATITVYLRVRNKNEVTDQTLPTASWEFGSRCENIAADSPTCSERFWMLHITAQDWQTGILRIQSNPSGLWYRNSYSVGSTEPLKATYLATCCEPKVSLTVYDAARNQRSYNIDVRDIVINEASITIIVLGSILLLIVLILIICGIVWCCRRRQTTINLPTYRSHSTRSME